MQLNSYGQNEAVMWRGWFDEGRGNPQCTRAFWKVRGLTAVRRSYTEGGSYCMPSYSGRGNVVAVWSSSI